MAEEVVGNEFVKFVSEMGDVEQVLVAKALEKYRPVFEEMMGHTKASLVGTLLVSKVKETDVPQMVKYIQIAAISSLVADELGDEAAEVLKREEDQLGELAKRFGVE